MKQKVTALTKFSKEQLKTITEYIGILEIPLRAQKGLVHFEINYIWEVLEMGITNLERTKQFGPKSSADLEEALDKFDLEITKEGISFSTKGRKRLKTLSDQKRISL